MGFKSAIIVVQDIPRSRYLYENLLHLRVTEDYGIYNVSFEGGLSMYGKDFFEQLIASQVDLGKHHDLALYIEVDNLEDAERQIVHNGFEFLHRIKEQPWKQRNFRFYDYDNHILEIAEKMSIVYDRLLREGETIEEISRLTSVPINQIQHEIEELRKNQQSNKP
jgi:catechol 2,3-dioxygenase-like lactoylglutathione lyase family enzyme